MTEADPSSTPRYRGSSKHKRRPADEQKGTLCPEWTHRTGSRGFATDVHTHDWKRTPAAAMFARVVVDDRNGRRFATDRGVAFETRSSRDGSWHGFPIPWENVPARIKDGWLDTGEVSRRDVKRFLRFDRHDIHWALRTDAE